MPIIFVAEGPVNQSQPSGEEHSRYKESDDDSMQDDILPSCQRPSGLPLDDVYTNGREYGFLLDSKRSDCKLAVPSEFAFYIPCTVLSLAETRGRIPRFFLESGFYRVVCYCVAC